MLVRDPVFQLNLLLWMAKEQPADAYVVRPLFFEQGYSILYIENPFPFPPDTLRAIEESKKEISKKPEPELILGRMRDKTALYFEAKANSFSSESETSKQARGHLLAAGEAFAEVMAPLRSCLLCYVVPEDNRPLMGVCLHELAAELATAGLKPSLHSCHGLAVESPSLRYSWDDSFRKHVGIAESSSVIMSGITEDTDPSPLFLIYTDEDYPDDEQRDLLRRCLVNQVHALLVCDINRVPPNELYQCSAESLLIEITDDLFRFLGRARQKGMRRLVTENVLRRIAEFSKDKYSGAVVVQGQQLLIRFPDESTKTAFLDWLEDFKRTTFQAKKPSDADKGTLFEQIEEDES